MGKIALTSAEKAQSYVRYYPQEFKRRQSILYCKMCRKNISCDKKTRVDAHRATPMHQLRLVNTGKGLETSCLETIKIYTINIEIFANQLFMKINTLFSWKVPIENIYQFVENKTMCQNIIFPLPFGTVEDHSVNLENFSPIKKIQTREH